VRLGREPVATACTQGTAERRQVTVMFSALAVVWIRIYVKDLFPQEITRALLNMISNGFYAATKRKAEANGGDYEPTLEGGVAPD
jgi:hypothetical protein